MALALHGFPDPAQATSENAFLKHPRFHVYREWLSTQARVDFACFAGI